MNEKTFEKYSVKIYKIDPYFCEHNKENTQAHKNGCEYMLFRIDVYFTEYLLAVEIDKKKTCWQRPYFWVEKTKSTIKKLGCQFIRINTSKRYDEDYEIGRIQTFIHKFKDRQLQKN